MVCLKKVLLFGMATELAVSVSVSPSLGEGAEVMVARANAAPAAATGAAPPKGKKGDGIMKIDPNRQKGQLQGKGDLDADIKTVLISEFKKLSTQHRLDKVMQEKFKQSPEQFLSAHLDPKKQEALPKKGNQPAKGPQGEDPEAAGDDDKGLFSNEIPDAPPGWGQKDPKELLGQKPQKGKYKVSKVPWKVSAGKKAFTSVLKTSGKLLGDKIPDYWGKFGSAFNTVGAVVNGEHWSEVAKAATSCIPFVNCVTQGITKEMVPERDDTTKAIDRLDVAACLIADALMYTPLAPFGYAIHGVRWVVDFFDLKPDNKFKEKKVEEMKAERNVAWRQFVDEKFLSEFASKQSGEGISTYLFIESAVRLYNNALSIGYMNASIGRIDQVHKDSNITAEEKSQLTQLFTTAADGVYQRTPQELINSQRASLVEYVDNMRADKSGASIKDRTKDFLEGFKQARLGGLSEGITKEVLTDDLPLPERVEVAFVVGQSIGQAKDLAAVQAIDAKTLDIPDAAAALKEVNDYLGQANKENRHKTTAPSSDKHVLVAMKRGIELQSWKPGFFKGDNSQFIPADPSKSFDEKAKQIKAEQDRKNKQKQQQPPKAQ
ncbi:hypothetical protein AAL_05318 [Moelleriella libera RCEF 2490]|uniref:Heat-labile enterotoxin, A chain n=1 Tax=Moelleriella libera RCEF 2490 TaxID=1081109 RepID=A0A168ATZ1_9HYPO|nr:hypothetical protein AAL_05318 [Moelleriella libera RCEF 2490]